MSGSTRQRCVLLTGAAGFLGSQIARRLLSENDLIIIALLRAENQAAAKRRLARAWWDWPELAAAIDDPLRLKILPGDVSLPHLGLDVAAYAHLTGCITHIIHSAADLRIQASLEELRKTNVAGTANMLAFARAAHLDHGLERYAHISTAYVAGRRSGPIPEADLTGAYGFSNAYEQSKYEGETLVQQAGCDLPFSVFRPGMIVGDVHTGAIRTFNTLYFPLKLYLSGKLPVIPVDPGLPVNLIPVDEVADSIVRLLSDPQAEGLTFHLTAPTNSLPRAGELLDFVRAWAKEHLGMRLPRPLFLHFPGTHKRFTSGRLSENHPIAQPGRWLFPRELRSLLTYKPYFNEQKQFQRDNTDRLLGPCNLNWREYLPNLLSYAAGQSFMHRTGRSVHEQLLARLESQSRPVRYFDIVDGRVIPHTSGEVRQQILAAAAALKAYGIQPGDRIAVVGLNSTRYLVLDAAIGLVGAVSVPLYYTSPPAEIDHILAASRARLLFIGAPKIMARLDEIQANLPVISFCRLPIFAGLKREVVPWEAFLAAGNGRSVPLQSPVGFGDLATLRYTSGTTGRPKGVSFQHQHLRWMAQTMASLLPWKARCQPARYLSFLPMNHVVEGILATYAPYYLPAPVDIYFLEDLKEIQRSLPRVRPTIFFSVPRIYEKIWEALESNPVGQRYLDLPSGPWKRALGVLLRWQTLRKAGLDRCAQLLTGSAPCSKVLLRRFRELGIEIHNAYGLTEAPLISLNRLGANRLGSVGAPLPETEIRIDTDGEVLVRGPQVMAGYDAAEGGSQLDQPFKDGWLQTGDLGHLSPEGALVLQGRKKELIKTSYGKYVEPARVESLLREIPGVAEAMLVGEQRPYCTALLWVGASAVDAAAGERIDQRVAEVNRSLSHPEQVKRWAVLANDLSIETGDLTANLKLKRQVVSRRMEAVLDELYNGMCPSPSVLHTGMSRLN